MKVVRKPHKKTITELTGTDIMYTFPERKKGRFI